MNLQNDLVMSFLDHCDRAGIRNPAEFLISKRPHCFDWLKGAFPRGILPTDIDGEVEINGHFLRFEFKAESRVRNGEIPKGQARLFQKLVETGFHTVFLIGVDNSGRPTCIQIYTTKNRSIFREADEASIFGLCKRWANAQIDRE
jgi:hypothetical protein